MAEKITDISKVRLGDIVEICNFHPAAVTEIDLERGNITARSLINPAINMTCSIEHCAVRSLSTYEVAWWILHGPADADTSSMKQDDKWWTTGSVFCEGLNKIMMDLKRDVQFHARERRDIGGAFEVIEIVFKFALQRIKFHMMDCPDCNPNHKQKGDT